MSSALSAIAEEEKKISELTCEFFGRRWLLNTLRNYATLAQAPTLYHLGGAGQGRPALLVSAGPSLDKNAHLLPEMAKRCIVIAGQHTLDILDKVGVVPDIVAAIDAGAMVPGHMRGHRAGMLFTAPVVRPAVMDAMQLEHGQCWAPANIGHDDWFWPWPREILIPNGGSVACTLMTIAWRMGCDPCIFVGQDLAMTGDRYYPQLSGDGEVEITYAEHEGKRYFYSLHPGRILHEHGPVVDLPEWSGVGTVPASRGLAAVHRWFEAATPLLRPNRWMNCTEGGARIEGMEHVTLEAAMAQIPDAPKGDIFGPVMASWEQQRPEVVRAMRARACEVRSMLRYARQHSDVCTHELASSTDRAVLTQRLKGPEQQMRKCLVQCEQLVLGLDRTRHYRSEKFREQREGNEALRRDIAIQNYRMIRNADILVGPELDRVIESMPH